MLFSTKKDIENSEKKSKEFFNILKRRGLQKALQSICGPQATNFYLSVVFLSQTKTLEIHCILNFFSFLKDPKVSKKPNQCSLIQFCFILFPNMKCGFFCVYHLILSTKKCLQTRRGREKVLFFCSFYTMLSCAKLKVWTNVKGLQKHAKNKSLSEHIPLFEINGDKCICKRKRYHFGNKMHKLVSWSCFWEWDAS